MSIPTTFENVDCPLCAKGNRKESETHVSSCCFDKPRNEERKYGIKDGDEVGGSEINPLAKRY
jgi:hypothetical protein